MVQQKAKIFSRSTRSRAAFMPFVPSQASSRTFTSSLRPLMPPASLVAASTACPAHEMSSPTDDTGPERMPMWPTLIVVGLTPTSEAVLPGAAAPGTGAPGVAPGAGAAGAPGADGAPGALGPPGFAPAPPAAADGLALAL